MKCTFFSVCKVHIWEIYSCSFKSLFLNSLIDTIKFFFLKELVRKGVPHHFRAIVWQLLCNAQNMPIKDQYSELLKMTSPCEKLIRRDIARTYPEHEFFKEKDSLGQEVLFNVMKVSSSAETLISDKVHSFGCRQRGCWLKHLVLSPQAYSLVDREVGYCQGSAFIVGLLLMQV